MLQNIKCRRIFLIRHREYKCHRILNVTDNTNVTENTNINVSGVAVDNRQNVYICDPKNHRVIKVYK